MGKITQWLAGVLAGITSIFSPGVSTLAETTDYLAYPPLLEVFTEDGDYINETLFAIYTSNDIQKNYYNDFMKENGDPRVYLYTFTWYGTPDYTNQENPLSGCTPVLRIIKFKKSDWEHDELNILYTEQTTFSQNVCITSVGGNRNLEYIECTYNEERNGWNYLTSSYESNVVRTNKLWCAYIVFPASVYSDDVFVISGTSEQYTGHDCLVEYDYPNNYSLKYNILYGDSGKVCKNPLYDFWLFYEGGGTPDPGPDPDPPTPPDPPDDNLNKDTNGDGIPDINIDTDNDGEADINIDTDGDDIPDINIDTNGDQKPDINVDTDGDQKPDINIDTDGDQKPDINIKSEAKRS